MRRFVEWEDFADHAMVYNPKGGTAVLPKVITETVHSQSKEKFSVKAVMAAGSTARAPKSPKARP